MPKAVAKTTSSPIQVGAVLFEGFELLDFYGPLEMFGLLEGDARITVVADKTGAVKSSSGPCGIAEAMTKFRNSSLVGLLNDVREVGVF